MKRRKLDTSDEKIVQRGAKPGDVRNPGGKGGFQPGISGNPSGRPVGSGNNLPELHNVWDAWRKSHGLSWLYYSLNYKLPLALFDTTKTLRSPEEVREIRSLLVKNFWRGMDFIRKTCAGKIADELSIDNDSIGLSELSSELKARADGKLISIEERTKRRAAL